MKVCHRLLMDAAAVHAPAAGDEDEYDDEEEKEVEYSISNDEESRDEDNGCVERFGGNCALQVAAIPPPPAVSFPKTLRVNLRSICSTVL